MHTTYVPQLVLATLVCAGSGWQPALAGSIDACALISKAEAAALIGSPVVAVTPTPEEKDDDTGGMLTYCTLRAANAAVVVSVVGFASAKEAMTKSTKEMAAARLDDDAAQVIEEKGLGERAFWGVTANGAQYTAVKGSRVLAVGVGGKLPRAPAAYREALRALVTKALAKL